MANSEQENFVEAIAVIGMAGRFPGAQNIDDYWQNLCDGKENISRFDAQDMLAAGLDPTLLDMPGYVNARGALDGIDLFDASFFGFSPRDAEILDPQQRIFLESAWQALEHGGYDPEQFEGLIGVFGGCGISTYISNLHSNPEIASVVGSYQITLANDKDHLTTRTAYKLNLKGPAVTVQTTCSTSLVAVVMACQSLLDYHCDMALAGGVKVETPQEAGYFYQEGGIASPDGHCRAFDADAQGTVGGNGVGIVLLKRLSEALADGDTIHAILRGSAINNDGSVKVGYTAPSIDGQAEAIAMVLAIAGLEPEAISYIEAHGTGTVLGDPVEVAALKAVFGNNNNHRCAIGSVKSNIGHLDTASGVAGLIKTILALKHGMIPPSLHFKRPNPKLDIANSPFYVNDSLRPWENVPLPRRAGVSSFGIGGTNAHVIVEEVPQTTPKPSLRGHHLLLLSARSEAVLASMTTNLTSHLHDHPELALADVAYTSQVGRRVFPYRRMFVCKDREDALKVLDANNRRGLITKRSTGEDKAAVFMFSGQGTQYVHMAAGLYACEPLFRDLVEQCAELLLPELGLDMREVLFPVPIQEEAAEQQLRQTAITQPALFIIEYALAQLLMDWDIQPAALIGHSIGEYVAACIGGVMSLEDALVLVAVRGRFMQQMAPGEMLAVALSEDKLRPYLEQEPAVSLAAVNSLDQCVISGTSSDIQRLETQFRQADILCGHLRTSHAFHSMLMEPMIEPFLASMKQIKLSPPEIPFVSNVSGDWITDVEAVNPRYWANHVRHTVRWADGLDKLLQNPHWVLLEVGPGDTLKSLAQHHPGRKVEQVVLNSLRRRRQKIDDDAQLLDTLGRLWLEGVPVGWAQFYGHEQRSRVPLPTYPFERQRYWIDAPRVMVTPGTAQQSTSDGRQMLDNWFYVPTWIQSPMLASTRSPRARWLVFVDDGLVGRHLADHLRKTNDMVATVSAGNAFQQLSSGTEFVINLSDKDHYNRLLGVLQETDQLPTHIVHLWSVTGDNDSLSKPDPIANAQQRGFYSLIYIAQALGRIAPGQPVDISVISNHLHAVTGQEQLLPEKATVLGPCHVIPQEYPQIHCRNIDITSAQDDMGWLANALSAEITAGGSEPVIAYRGRERWIQRFERVVFDETDELPPLLRSGGTYLITGGLGGIGLVLARHLAQTVGARLALVGRSAFPQPDEWNDWITQNGPDDKISQKIKLLKELESLGAEVAVFSADVADHEEMSSVINGVYERFDTLHGVIHAAGVAGGGIIQLKNSAIAEPVFRPKVSGTMILDSLLKDKPLDFILLCSSMAAVFGGAGQVDYCGANAFLDAYANATSLRRERVAFAINWDRWQEVGMAVDTETPLGHATWAGITPEEGVIAFDRVLQSLWPQVIVSSIDFRGFLQQPTAPRAERAEQVTASTRLESQAHDRPELENEFVAAASPTEQAIVQIFEALLGIKPVGVHDSFFALGGHSLLMVQLLSRLRDNLQIELSLEAVFDAPTAAELAALVETVRWVAQSDQTDIASEEAYEEGEI